MGSRHERSRLVAAFEHGVVFWLSFVMLVVQIAISKLLALAHQHDARFLVITAAIAGMGVGAAVVLTFSRVCSRARLFVIAALVLLVASGLATMLLHPASVTARYVLVGTLFCAIGVLITFVFHRHQRSLYRLYFSNLLGAGAGAILLPVFFRHFGVEKLLFAIAVTLAVWAALALALSRSRHLLLLLGPSAALLLYSLRFAQPVPCGEYDAASYRDRVQLVRWNEHSRLDIGRREVPIERNLSPLYRGARTLGHPCILDCHEAHKIAGYSSIITRFDHLESLQHELSYVPHHLLSPDASILIVGAGGGKDVAAARLTSPHYRITAVEMNSLYAEVMRERFPASYERIYGPDEVELYLAEIRSFLARTSAAYDLIELPIIKAQPSLAAGNLKYGTYNIYTVEALSLYLAHLAPDGILSVTWYFQRPFFLRLMNTLQAASGAIGQKIALLQNGRFGVLLFRKSGFDEAARVTLAAVAVAEGFTMHYPSATPNEFTALADRGEHEPQLDLRPIPDDRPFFFWFDKTAALDRVTIPLTGAAVFLVLLLAAVSVPGRWRSAAGLASVPYFAGLGTGYILIELFFVQKLSLFIGEPVFGFSAVVAGLLLFNSLGSLSFRRLGVRIQTVFVGIVLLCALAAAFLDPVLDALREAGLAGRVAWSLLLLSPIGYVLGIPFPYGLSQVRKSTFLHPFAWILNAAGTVLGMAVSLLVAMMWGFRASIMLAAVCYAIAVVAARWLKTAGAGAPAVEGSS